MAKIPQAPASGVDGTPLLAATVAEASVLRLLASRQRLASALSAASQEPQLAGKGAATLVSAIRQHPFVAVGVAAAAGAAVIGAKPWRSLRNPVVLAAVGPVLLAAAQSEPKSMWLDLLMLAYENLSKADKRD